MNKITKISIGIGCAVLAIGACLAAYVLTAPRASSERFVEGRHFKVLPVAYAAPDNHVDNYYWLKCASCYMFEGALRKSSKEMGFEVEKIHAIGNDKWIEDSKLDTTFRILNKAALIDSFFDVVNADHSLIGDKAKIDSFLDLYQVDRSQFWNTYNSPASLAMSIGRTSNTPLVDIRVVPTFVVSGKYKILLGGLRTNDELPELIDYLIKNKPEHNPELDQEP